MRFNAIVKDGKKIKRIVVDVESIQEARAQLAASGFNTISISQSILNDDEKVVDCLPAEYVFSVVAKLDEIMCFSVMATDARDVFHALNKQGYLVQTIAKHLGYPDEFKYELFPLIRIEITKIIHNFEKDMAIASQFNLSTFNREICVCRPLMPSNPQPAPRSDIIAEVGSRSLMSLGCFIPIGIVLCFTGIGAILGFPIILGSLVLTLLGFFVKKIDGKCPYCQHNISVDSSKAGLNCDACANRIVIRNNMLCRIE